RAGRVRGRRHQGQRRRRPARGPRPAARGHPEAGVEPRRQGPARLPRRLDRGAGQRRTGRLRQRLQGAVGGLPRALCRGPRVPLRLPLRRARRAPGRSGPDQLRRGPPHQPRPAHGGVSTMSDLPLTLLEEDGSLRTIALAEAPAFARPTAPLRSRVVYAAVHVVPQVHGDPTPGAPAAIDWDATLAFRRTMWSRGLGVADAMDTAQRNMGLDPAATRELISRSAEAARAALEDPEIAAVFPAGAAVSDLVVAGVNTDQRAEPELSLDEIVEAYLEQLRATEATGAGAVLMASRHLARTARTAADYEAVYRRVLEEATAPVVIHWLGTVFDPQLEGYFGSTDSAEAARTMLRIIERDPAKIRGVKMSLLN